MNKRALLIAGAFSVSGLAIASGAAATSSAMAEPTNPPSQTVVLTEDATGSGVFMCQFEGLDATQIHPGPETLTTGKDVTEGSPAFGNAGPPPGATDSHDFKSDHAVGIDASTARNGTAEECDAQRTHFQDRSNSIEQSGIEGN